MNATVYLYAFRGTKWAKIKLSDATLISDGSETATAEAVTGSLYVKSANGTQGIGVFMNGTAYRIITAVSGTATDTHAAHASELIRVASQVSSTALEPRIIGAVGQTVKQIILSGSVTFSSDVWEDIAILPDNVTPTAIALDGGFVIIGTNKGPFFLDGEFLTFRSLMESVGANVENCRAMSVYSFIGLLVNLQTGTRYMKNVDTGNSVGPETYLQNLSPVRGRMTAFCHTERWGYMPIYDPNTGDTHLCAVRPRQIGDWHNNPLSYYPLAKFTDTNCNALIFTDTEGGRTYPTIFGGYNDDVFHMTLGTSSREIDDTGYTFAPSGTWYGTRMTRHPDKFKRVEAIQIKTENCSATQTVTVSVAVDDGPAQAIGYTITSDGIHTLKVPPGGLVEGAMIQPSIALATATSAASPKVVGKLRMFYRTVPLRDVNNETFGE
jgi:hypothetical protein